MRSRAVSETWRAEARTLTVSDFFAELPRHAFTFLHGDGRWVMLAEDPLAIQEHPGHVAFHFERSGPMPPILPDLFGHATYEFGYGLDPALPGVPPPVDGLPDFQLSLHKTLRLYDRKEGILYSAERCLERELEPRLHGLGAGHFEARKRGDSDDAASYQGKVQRIREGIAQGDVYQVNLTRQEQWGYTGDLADFAQRLQVVNPAPHSALVAEPGWAIVSSSPESFFRIDQGRIRTRPIKGTAPRGLDSLADLHLREGLWSSPKNRSELAMIVDLLRNDLTRICRIPSVTVEAFPTLESYANVHHLVAEVSGDLLPDLSLEAVFQAMFPGGSITGCPKLAAMGLIRELEPCPRRIYTGALGWCRADFQQAEFSIPIRTAWATGGELHFGVGGGVVWDSDPREEYEETVHKGRSLVQCLS
ncbi:MAG: anthranilate synthase component I family protein [Holophaga sp.]|nr:anthranilate synthase component I family protein [Holophaga sp.]